MVKVFLIIGKICYGSLDVKDKKIDVVIDNLEKSIVGGDNIDTPPF